MKKADPDARHECVGKHSPNTGKVNSVGRRRKIDTNYVLSSIIMLLQITHTTKFHMV